MDKYYGNVCELDIIFNFQKAYFILDELLLAGELQESSKKNVLRCISQEDSLEDMEVSMCLDFPFLRARPVFRGTVLLRGIEEQGWLNLRPCESLSTVILVCISTLIGCVLGCGSGRRRCYQDHVEKWAPEAKTF